MVSCSSLLAPLIFSGDLHTARFAALDYCRRRPLGTVNANAAKECARAWGAHVDLFLDDDENALDKIDAAHRGYSNGTTSRFSLEQMTLPAPPLSPKEMLEDMTSWERCCKRIHFGREEQLSPPVGGCGPGRASPDSIDCALGVGSGGALTLPLIHEISLRIRLPRAGCVLDMDQDGILQPYDPASMLWPGGYLLSLWVNDFLSCLSTDQNLPLCTAHQEWLGNLNESMLVVKRPLSILELGTGIGAASVAAVASVEAFHISARILATDRSAKSLALATANAALNGLNNNMDVKLLDFTDPQQVAQVVTEFGPFDIVLGASLEFELWKDRLYNVLGALTRDGGLVALAHVTSDIDQPPADSCFEEIGRISGLRYGMQMLWKEGESCFEIVLLRKKNSLLAS